jgi:hypothetical protein
MSKKRSRRRRRNPKKADTMAYVVLGLGGVLALMFFTTGIPIGGGQSIAFQAGSTNFS